MIDSIKSEARKLGTVRSTYVIIALTLLLTIFSAYSIGSTFNSALSSPDFLNSRIRESIAVIAIVPALIGLLLFGHEYRYNTIMYTLTASKNRFRVLASKIIVITSFVLLLMLIVVIILPLLIAASTDGTLSGQTFDFGSLVAHSLFCAWGYAMFAMIYVALIRNQAGAITAFLITPFLAENTLRVLLKVNVKYLPFRSLTEYLLGGSTILIPLAYIVGLWGVAYYFFLKRDAN